MEATCTLRSTYLVILIGDYTHTMGASRNGTKYGNFVQIACFSTRTKKQLISGEGGLPTTNDEQIMARAIMHSGSYMLFSRQGATPDEIAFEQIRMDMPNYSGWMGNLRAADLNAQLRLFDENCKC